MVEGTSNGIRTAEWDRQLRDALESNGQRYTDQRAAVYHYLLQTDTHPTADDVFITVRHDIPDISLATVYKSLETLVGCGLAVKLTYGDGSARYDGRTDPHHHARCLTCGAVKDVPGRLEHRPCARWTRARDSQWRVTARADRLLCFLPGVTGCWLVISSASPMRGVFYFRLRAGTSA